jgi:hypothetical protein
MLNAQSFKLSGHFPCLRLDPQIKSAAQAPSPQWGPLTHGRLLRLSAAGLAKRPIQESNANGALLSRIPPLSKPLFEGLVTFTFH